MSEKKQELHFAVLSVDTVIFRIHEGQLQILLIPVRIPEFEGMFGLPGGLVDPKETAYEAAARHAQTKAGVEGCYVEQLYTFSGLDRDPRGRVVSVAHIALLQDGGSENVSKEAVWKGCKDIESLAYDHMAILDVAIERLKNKLAYTTVIRYLLPDLFTLTQLQESYEVILMKELDKRNFRKKILSLDIVTETKETFKGGANRPAALYKWKGEDPGQIDIL